MATITICRQQKGSKQASVYCICMSQRHADTNLALAERKDDGYTYWIQTFDSEQGIAIGDDCEYAPDKCRAKTQEEWLAKAFERKGDPEYSGRQKKQHVFVPCRFGTLSISEPCKPSYAGIDSVNRINDPVRDGVIHVVEITPEFVVLFNGAEIARAPEPVTIRGKGKSQWSPARRKAWCNAVVWSIIPREMCVFNGGKGGAVTMELDDAELRRYIALYPALIQNQTPEMQQIMRDESVVVPAVLAVPNVPAMDNVGAEWIVPANWGFPEIEIVDPVDDCGTMDDILQMAYEARQAHHDPLDEDCQNETPDMVITAFAAPRPSTLIRMWSVPHLRVSIQELMCSA